MQMNPIRTGITKGIYQGRCKRIRVIANTGGKIRKSQRSGYVFAPVCNCCCIAKAKHVQWQKYPRKHSLRDHKS